jgi:glycosyltransferase involved in cell wall biosynthesis
LSDWVLNIWKQYQICDELQIVTVPFGIDTARFNDEVSDSATEAKGNLRSQNKTEVIIYYKHRNPSELNFIANELKKMSIKFSTFSYDHKYDENIYINYLKRAKYCIWIDGHESQGFALQEALSCNVPLLVWNVTSMNQEYGQNYDDIQATTIPYWDERCGEVFYKSEEFVKTFETFLSKLDTYKPREFILENLSEEVCEIKLINTINNITI